MADYPSNPDCIFCKIVAGEVPGKKVYEDEHCLAFLDINPLADGHTMVIPKGHYPLLEDMPAEVAGHLMRVVARVSAAQRSELGVLSTTIGINNGPEAGQVVPHIHVHVVPRRSTDGGGSVHSIVQDASGRDLDEVAELLRRGLGG